MAKEIIWSHQSRIELLEILEYWADRNKSKSFSKKLYHLIQEQLQLLTKFPLIGRKTDFEGVLVKIVQNYLIYYKVQEEKIPFFPLDIKAETRRI